MACGLMIPAKNDIKHLWEAIKHRRLVYKQNTHLVSQDENEWELFVLGPSTGLSAADEASFLGGMRSF